jgi:hypothetical protein
VLAERLVLRFSIPFKGILWNTAALPAKKILYMELRDEARRSVTFSALRYDSGRLLWKDRTMPERWWVTLLGASEETLLIQRYNPDNPEMKSLYALDAETGTLRWNREDFAFSKFHPGCLSGVTGDSERSPLVLDLKSGEIMSPVDVTEIDSHKISDPVRPFLYQEGTSYRATVSDYLSANFGHSPEGGVEYLEFGGKVVISYHIRARDGLTNYLLALDESGGILLQENMASGLTGLGTDTFFVLSGCLFFVRNREELLSYQLI